MRSASFKCLQNALISIKIEFRNHGQAFSELKMPYDAVVAADFADFRKGRGYYEVQKMDDSRCRTGIFLFTAQPAYAAPVIVAGSGSLAAESMQTVGEQQAPEAVTQAPGAGQTETTAAVSQSPTIVSGQGQSAPDSTGSENSAPVSAGEVTGIPEGPGGIKSEPVTPVTPEELAAQEAAQAAAQQSTGQSQTTDGIDPSKPMVALTFDDGPQPSVGNRIMDCLAQYGGKATFFMVGERVGSYKTEVQRMVAEGHEVANHTMNHKYLQKLGAAQIQAQVNNGNDAIQAACGVRPTLLRLPGGNHNATVLANAGMPMIQWNVDTLDWKTRNADKTVAAVLNHVKDGDIILMHELYGATGDAVARIVPAVSYTHLTLPTT